ncbi:MAG: GTP-binding protein [Sulfurimonas sp.]|nr:GTP-binding protein [Sulfurimonas sp.]
MKILILTTLLLQSLLFASYGATIFDKNTSLPIKNATISDSSFSVKSDENGSFTIDSNEKSLHVKACGYRPYEINVDENKTIIKLKPFTAKALYLSFWHASNNSNRFKDVLEIIEKAKLNTIVVDVKNEYGSTSFFTSFEQANRYGAYKKRTNRNIEQFIELMRSKNIYTIARIVTFKDELQASNNLDYAIKRADGSIWRNHDDIAWVDPFDKRAHEYTIAIAEEAAKVGFDEINFDYIRFPAKAGLVFSKENTQKNRLKAIESFLSSAQNKLRKYGVFISADTYGNICWSKDDNNIGQTVESLSKHADYLAPMLYPSGFATGSFFFKYPAEHPYAVVYRSIKNIKDRIDLKRIRPWLQYFKDYSYTKKYYRKFEINEQIRATEDINTSGWMLWSPSSKYHLNYFIEEDE